jgi:hypothetical protein
MRTQALDRTQPLRIDFGTIEKRTHAYLRRSPQTCSPPWSSTLDKYTRRLFSPASYGRFPRLHGPCRRGLPGRTAAARHRGQPVHPLRRRGRQVAGPPPQRDPALPTDRQLLAETSETWLGIIPRQAIRRGTFRSLRHLILRIKEYVTHWNIGPCRQDGRPDPMRPPQRPDLLLDVPRGPCRNMARAAGPFGHCSRGRRTHEDRQQRFPRRARFAYCRPRWICSNAASRWRS